MIRTIETSRMIAEALTSCLEWRQHIIKHIML